MAFKEFITAACWTCKHASFALEKPETCFDCVNLPKDWETNDASCEFWRNPDHMSWDEEWDCPDECRMTVITCHADIEETKMMDGMLYYVPPAFGQCEQYSPKIPRATFNPNEYHKMEEWAD